jgi:hypothetical protein
MGLFGNSEEKKEQKTEAILSKYNLNDLSDPRDRESIVKIAQSMAGVGLIAAGADIGLGTNEKAMIQAQMHYQKVIMEQNFIMIRQLDRIAKSLEQK